MVGIVIVALLATSLLLRPPQFVGDITEFLPLDSEAALMVRELTRSSLSRNVVLLVSGPSAAGNAAVAGELAEALRAEPVFASIDRGYTGRGEDVHRLYLPLRYNFARATERELEALDDAASMRAAAKRFIASMQGRWATLLHRLGPDDPLLLYVDQLDRIASLSNSGLEVVAGQYHAPDGTAVVFGELAESALDSTNAATAEDAIERAWASHSSSDVTLTASGVYRHTAAISAMIKRDVQRVTVISVIGIALLFVIVFGRIRAVALPLTTIGVGGLAALVVSSLATGTLHLLTLAFGAALIGVAVDYSLHSLTHRDRSRVWPAIRTGVLTTMAGFGALFASSVETLQQVALFGVVGVAVAAAATYVAGSTFDLDALVDETRLARANALAERLFRAVRNRRAAAIFLALPVAASALIGLPELELQTDVASLTTPIAELAEADRRVRETVARMGASDVVIVRGADAQGALARNDELAAALGEAVHAGELDHFSSLHALVWSADLQTMNRRFFHTHAESLVGHLEAAFEAEGVEASRLAPVRDGRFDVADRNLELHELRASELGRVVALFDPSGDGRLLLTHLGEVHDEAAVARRVGLVQGAYRLRQRAALDEAWSVLAREVVIAIAFGILLIALAAALARRRLRAVVVVLAPPLAAAAGTLGFLTLLGVQIGPIHGLALLLVIAVAADYGVMLEAHREHAALGIATAWISTILAFGALTFSAHPVLHAFGTTIAIGVTFATWCLPLADQLPSREPS